MTTQIKERIIEAPRAYVPFHLAVKSSQPRENVPADKQQGITLNSLIHKEISLHIRRETKSWQAYSVAKLQEFKKKAKLKAIIYENKSIATPTISPLLQPHAINQHKQGKRRLRWIDMIWDAEYHAD